MRAGCFRNFEQRDRFVLVETGGGEVVPGRWRAQSLDGLWVRAWRIEGGDLGQESLWLWAAYAHGIDISKPFRVGICLWSGEIIKSRQRL